MKILIITQKVNMNDAILGFFHEWIREFAKECAQATVICLEKGAHNLPENVRVFSLGKEQKGKGAILRFTYLRNFFTHIVRERKNYDVVFVHMNPIYVIIGGLVWKLLGKKVALWYTHKHVDFKLRLATLVADVVFSASAESFRLKTPKLKIFGHGIDTDKFAPSVDRGISISYNQRSHIMLSVGRISETKNQLLMIKAVQSLSSLGINLLLEIVGSPISEADRVYKNRIEEYVVANKFLDRVQFLGDISPVRIPEKYCKADIFINLSNTGSLDKAVLEAMSSGLQIVTSNEAFKNIVPAENFVSYLTEDKVASAMKALIGKPADPALRDYVVKNHNLKLLIPKLLQALTEIR